MVEALRTAAEMLDAWREAARAAELAQRLAKQAVETAAQANLDATAAEEVATLARQSSDAALIAADLAARVATEARRISDHHRDHEVPGAADADMEATAAEAEARDAYHRAEEAARARNRGEVVDRG